VSLGILTVATPRLETDGREEPPQVKRTGKGPVPDGLDTEQLKDIVFPLSFTVTVRVLPLNVAVVAE
jgi:hypothetical protein